MEDDLKINALEKPYDEESLGIPPRWEPEHVGRRLVKAFMTSRSSPPHARPARAGRTLAATCRRMGRPPGPAELSEAERRSREAAQNFTMLRPSSAEIAEMESAFDWLRELRAVDSGMALVTSLWALRTARRKSVRRLCIEKKWAPHTFYRKRAKALAFLAELLNSRNVPVF